MTDSAQIRRSPKLRRIFSSPRQVGLEPPRDRSDSLAYLAGMSETSHAYPGLESVLTTSELATHLGVPVQTIHDLRYARRGPRGFRPPNDPSAGSNCPGGLTSGAVAAIRRERRAT
jgi:hypothetical protein